MLVFPNNSFGVCTVRSLATFIIMVYTLTACGLKGPLYLPPEDDANNNSIQKSKKK